MVDQELDALLVGALYGELGPADEARLAAHLESHPTDRSALDDLRSTRKALLDARFFELWFDPPPAVSALLVQEAARRAPRSVIAHDGDGWFMRFVRSFAAHPAMAAAAMFVVVLGVAGTLYMKKGADLAVERPAAVAVSGSTTPAAQAPAVADVPAAAPVSQTVTTGADGIVAGLEEGGKDEPRAAAVTKTKPAAAAPKGIIVAHHEAMPKELDKNEDDAANLAGDYKQGVAKAAASPPPVAPATPPVSEVTTVGGAGAAPAANQQDQKEQQQDSWAREQHARVASLVQGGRCVDAAPLAAEIKSRAPDYYSSYVATDRSIKACLPYIARAVKQQDTDRAKAAASKAAKAAPADSTK